MESGSETVWNSEAPSLTPPSSNQKAGNRMSQNRIEKDSMGPVEIPVEMMYGAQTERARRNFPISRLRFDRRFLYALGAIKRAAAEVNEELGLLDSMRAGAIKQAAQEVMDGDLDAHFVLTSSRPAPALPPT